MGSLPPSRSNDLNTPRNEKQKTNGRTNSLYCSFPSISLIQKLNKKPNNSRIATTTATTNLDLNNENIDSNDNDIENQRDLTKPRRLFVWVAEICAVISIFFAILMQIGSTYNRKALTNIYFIKLDLSHIIPRSIPNAGLINSVTQSLGLRDFYQVGLWGYCEGYFDQGVTYCSPPKKLFWFNPVEVLTSQLLAGATIALPSELTSVLNIVKLISQAIFVCFLVGTVSLIFGWLPSKSRWWSGGVGFLSFLAAILHVGAAIASTIMYILFRTVFNYTEFSIGAYLGISMFVFMWMNAGFALTNFIVQSGLCCCGISKRKNRRKNLAENKKRLRWIGEHEERVARSVNSSKNSSNNPSRNPSRTNSSKIGIGTGAASGRTSPEASRALDMHEAQNLDGIAEHEPRRRRPPMPPPVPIGPFMDTVEAPASGIYYEANEFIHDKSNLRRI